MPELTREPGAALAGQRLAAFPYLGGNQVELLVDGEATFAVFLDGIDRARDYVLVQFYIVRDDRIGRELADRLIARARAGVAVRFLYDEIGSGDLDDYRERLAAAGVEVAPFGSTRGSGNRFQLNFRNHRKIVVVDGVEGWVGGHNVGDEYLGRDPEIGPWRDTHLRVAGPAALGLQLSFLEDWSWATGESLFHSARLAAREARGKRGARAAERAGRPARDREPAVPAGDPGRAPTDLDRQPLLRPRRRRPLRAAPRGAARRRRAPADPRPLRQPDSSTPPPGGFFGPLLESGIAIHRYQGGFLHSKHFVIDDRLAGVGTANLDNRSFRLNFEVAAVVADEALAAAGGCDVRTRPRPLPPDDDRRSESPLLLATPVH